jgi:hypothetical protein
MDARKVILWLGKWEVWGEWKSCLHYPDNNLGSFLGIPGDTTEIKKNFML